MINSVINCFLSSFFIEKKEFICYDIQKKQTFIVIRYFVSVINYFVIIQVEKIQVEVLCHSIFERV